VVRLLPAGRFVNRPYERVRFSEVGALHEAPFRSTFLSKTSRERMVSPFCHCEPVRTLVGDRRECLWYNPFSFRRPGGEISSLEKELSAKLTEDGIMQYVFAEVLTLSYCFLLGDS